MGRKSKEQIRKERANASTRRWHEAHYRMFSISFSKDKDVEVLKKLDSVSSKTDYIRQLILADIRAHSEEN